MFLHGGAEFSSLYILGKKKLQAETERHGQDFQTSGRGSAVILQLPIKSADEGKERDGLQFPI